MLNQCNFIGRLGGDPEVRYTTSGSQVTTFTIACGKKYKDKSGQQVEETEWVRVAAWNKLAEICGEFLKKGSLVYLSGEMKTRKWQDQSGNDKYSTEIIAREMRMLGGKNEGGSQQQNPEPSGGDFYGGSTGGDVPF